MTLIGWQVASVNIRIMAPKSRKRQMMFVVTRRYAFRYVTLFWATVCKTIRSILSVLCPVCRSVCLSCPVTLVYYGQTVEWIKTTLGMEIGLGPGHNVLDWDRASLPERDRAPNFKPISVVPNGLIHPAVWHNRYGLKIVT